AMRAWVLAAVLLAGCATDHAASTQAPASEAAAAPSLGDILAQSPASDWAPLDPLNTLYMELPTGRVVIQLSPDFSAQHAANVRALAHANYWEGAAITRVQDNYVTQWGRPEEAQPHDMGAAVTDITAPEYFRPVGDLPFTRLPDPDSY